MTQFLLALLLATLINTAMAMEQSAGLATAASLLLAAALLAIAVSYARKATARGSLGLALAGWYLAPALEPGLVPVALPNLAMLAWLAREPAALLAALPMSLLFGHLAVLAALALFLVTLVRSHLENPFVGLRGLLRGSRALPDRTPAPADAAIAAAGGAPVAPAAAPATAPVPFDDEAVRALQSALLRIARLEAWRDEVLASGNLAHAAPSMEPTRSGQDDGAVYPPILPEGFEPDHHWHDGKAVLFPDSPDPEDIDPRDLPPEATHPRQVDLFSETGDGAFLGRFTPERRRP